MGSVVLRVSTSSSASWDAKKGGGPAGAAVDQGVRPLGIVGMNPLEHGFIVSPKLGRPGRGVVGAFGDEGQGQEAFAGTRMK